MDNGTAFTDKPGWQEMQFIEETDGRDPRLAQSIRTPGYTRIGQTKVEGPMFDVTVTGYQPVKFVQDPTSNSNNNDRVDSSDCDMPVYRFGEVLLIYAEAKAELGTDIFLSEDTKGYMAFHKDVERTKFNEGRDYLYPIPSGERSLNKNLTQNPGWNDGLGF